MIINKICYKCENLKEFRYIEKYLQNKGYFWNADDDNYNPMFIREGEIYGIRTLDFHIRYGKISVYKATEFNDYKIINAKNIIRKLKLNRILK